MCDTMIVNCKKWQQKKKKQSFEKAYDDPIYKPPTHQIAKFKKTETQMKAIYKGLGLPNFIPKTS